MSKQLGIIIGVIILVLVVGAVAYTQVKKPQKPSGQSSVQASPKAEEGTVRGSIKSLLGIGKNVMCNVSYNDQPGSSGTIYVSDKKMRGDFIINVNNKPVENHMISDGAILYGWSLNVGTKMKLDAIPSPSPSAQSQNADINKDVDLKCSSWSVDNSKFTPPSDVKFTDLSEFMKPVNSPASSGTNNSSKSYCDQITDPQAKAACLSY